MSSLLEAAGNMSHHLHHPTAGHLGGGQGEPVINASGVNQDLSPPLTQELELNKKTQEILESIHHLEQEFHETHEYELAHHHHGHGNERPHYHGHSAEPQEVSLAAWKWHHVESYVVVTLFILLSGLCKLIFHKMHWLSSRVPESCLLILVGIAFGAIMDEIDRCRPEDFCVDGRVLETFPEFTPTLFFYVLLPPIILESAFSLHNRVFMGNLRTILVYAVFGTIFNFLLIGAFLILFYQIGWMGDDTVYERKLIGSHLEDITEEGKGTVYSSLTSIQILLFSSLISAVDPVAVLAIFSEVGVNPDLYFLVFGESLLNDGVAVVLYNMMIAFAGLESTGTEVSSTHIITGVFSFFTIALGGLAIGIIVGIITGLVTKHMRDLEVCQPMSVFCLAYLAYLLADLVGWSGIISLIGCGLIQAHYSFKNISENSIITIKYFIKVLSSTADCIIFLYLGMAIIGEQIWHTGFVCWSLVLCLVVRTLGTFLLTFVINKFRHNIGTIDYQEQFVMAYGGLRGAVGFSLVKLIPSAIVPAAGLFVTTTLAVIMSTVFIQGGTIKSLVKMLDITLAHDKDETLTEEVNKKLFDHIMSGVEIISGKYGHFYINARMERLDRLYFKRWLCIPDYDRKMKKVYQEMRLTDHLLNLYGPTIILAETLDKQLDPNMNHHHHHHHHHHGQKEGHHRQQSSHSFTAVQITNKQESDLETGPKSLVSVNSRSNFTAKDREELSNALRVDPVKKFQMVRDRNIESESDLDVNKWLEKRRESADKVREIVLKRQGSTIKELRSMNSSFGFKGVSEASDEPHEPEPCRLIFSDINPNAPSVPLSKQRLLQMGSSTASLQDAKVWKTTDRQDSIRSMRSCRQDSSRLLRLTKMLDDNIGVDKQTLEAVLNEQELLRRRKSSWTFDHLPPASHLHDHVTQSKETTTGSDQAPKQGSGSKLPPETKDPVELKRKKSQ